MKQLPVKVIVDIFNLGCDIEHLKRDPSDFLNPAKLELHTRRPKPFVRGPYAVCTLWRRLIRQCGTLWISRMVFGDVYFEREVPSLSRNRAILEQLEESPSDLDVHINLYSGDFHELFRKFLFPKVMTYVISTAAPFIRTLCAAHLTRSRAEVIMDALITSESLPRLTHLLLSTGEVGDIYMLPDSLSNAPMLHHITFSETIMQTDRFLYSQLGSIHLHVSALSHDSNVISIVTRNCRTLVDLTLRVDLYIEPPRAGDPNVELPMLKSLVICSSTPSTTNLLLCLSLPQVRTLYVQSTSTVAGLVIFAPIRLPNLSDLTVYMCADDIIDFLMSVRACPVSALALLPTADCHTNLGQRVMPQICFPALRIFKLDWCHSAQRSVNFERLHDLFCSIDLTSVTRLTLRAEDSAAALRHIPALLHPQNVVVLDTNDLEALPFFSSYRSIQKLKLQVSRSGEGGELKEPVKLCMRNIICESEALWTRLSDLYLTALQEDVELILEVVATIPCRLVALTLRYTDPVYKVLSMPECLMSHPCSSGLSFPELTSFEIQFKELDGQEISSEMMDSIVAFVSHRLSAGRPLHALVVPSKSLKQLRRKIQELKLPWK